MQLLVILFVLKLYAQMNIFKYTTFQLLEMAFVRMRKPKAEN